VRELALVACILVPSLIAARVAIAADPQGTPVATSGDDNADKFGALAEITVTAQKRSESINDVGMSITALSGAQLQQKGVADVAQLTKVVPGFNFNLTGYGTPVYTIRGVGFQENSLGASPTVSVYVDEVPIAFPVETLGAPLDLERVEVLKGPQGILYGENSTGGAINYVAAKPTSDLRFGADASQGRFNTSDISAFISGPLSDTLRARVAVRTLQGGAWQQSYTRADELGTKDQIIGRVMLEWTPVEALKVSASYNGWRDQSQSQATQLIGRALIGIPATIYPPYAAQPLAPSNARAADWDPGVSLKQNSRFSQGTVRADYELAPSLTLTAISSYEKYGRYNPIDQDGTPYEDFLNYLEGKTSTWFEEVRLSGRLSESGHWLVGGNFQRDQIYDTSTLYNGQSTQAFLGGTSRNVGRQDVKTKSVYLNGDQEILSGLSLLAGARFTQADRTYAGCTQDIGDGKAIATGIFPGASVGGCLTLLNNGTFGMVHNELNQNNVSWRAGVNFKLTPAVLLYGNLSKGYKSGSFPLLGLAYEPEAKPVTQESVLSYEAGFKATLARTLQLNGAVFYYDYNDKQIRGFGTYPIFGTLETLLNIPKSHIEGFETNAVWSPLPGLSVSPAITLVKSQIDGDFVNLAADSQVVRYSGEPFPYTPKWSGNTDVEYRRSVATEIDAFIGANASYRSGTNGSPGELNIFRIPGYTLLDVRLGIAAADGKWSASLWGHNITDKYYWQSATRNSDSEVRFAGMPATYGVSVSYRY
jgi:outer membrane receptor protein involved in Fe transport